MKKLPRFNSIDEGVDMATHNKATASFLVWLEYNRSNHTTAESAMAEYNAIALRSGAKVINLEDRIFQEILVDVKNGNIASTVCYEGDYGMYEAQKPGGKYKKIFIDRYAKGLGQNPTTNTVVIIWMVDYVSYLDD